MVQNAGGWRQKNTAKTLIQADIKPAKFHDSKRLTFEFLLLDFDKKTDPSAYTNIILHNAQKNNGQLKANINGIILSDGLVFPNDLEKVFTGLIEIIYQVRCMLVHGELPPTSTNHEVVKYSYLVLFELMRDFCT
ncbi:MAG: hypothetical protein NTY50_00900 [Methylobacter sp.]|nr:hypothetical protein [Methylobacter sp.]